MIERTGRMQRPRGVRRRLGVVARTLLVLAFTALGFVLFRMQVLEGERYELQAREHRLRALTVRAPRGTIYDRHGRVVAENSVGHEVLLMPGNRRDMAATLDRLRPLPRPAGRLGWLQSPVE